MTAAQITLLGLVVGSATGCVDEKAELQAYCDAHSEAAVEAVMAPVRDALGADNEVLRVHLVAANAEEKVSRTNTALRNLIKATAVMQPFEAYERTKAYAAQLGMENWSCPGLAPTKAYFAAAEAARIAWCKTFSESLAKDGQSARALNQAWEAAGFHPHLFLTTREERSEPRAAKEAMDNLDRRQGVRFECPSFQAVLDGVTSAKTP